MDAGQQARSINRRLSCLKTYFRFLKKRGHTQTDPMQKVVGPKTPKRLPVVAREPEIQRLFSEVSFPEGYKGALHRLILETLYATGMRRSELSKITLQDIDFSRSVIRITGKGNKVRLAPMAGYLNALMNQFVALRAAHHPDDHSRRLFLSDKGVPLSPESIYAIVKKYLSFVSSAEQRSPHVLRHSFATHLSDHGADLNAIRELLGHSNLAATQVYMHNSIEKLKKVYEQAHPKGESEDKKDPEQP